jgi:DNA-directed RNA polymerase specialized sigma24 family protein
MRKSIPPDQAQEQTVHAPWHVSHNGVLLCSDQDGLFKLLSTYREPLTGYIRVRLRSQLDRSGLCMDPEDLAADAFERVRDRFSRGGKELDNKDGLLHYCISVVKHALSKKSKKRSIDSERRDPSSFEETTETHWGEPFDSLEDRETRGIRNRQEERILKEFLDYFKDRETDWYIIHRHRVFDESFPTIAKVLGMETDAVRQRYGRALKSFKKSFVDKYPQLRNRRDGPPGQKPGQSSKQPGESPDREELYNRKHIDRIFLQNHSIHFNDIDTPCFEFHSIIPESNTDSYLSDEMLNNLIVWLYRKSKPDAFGGLGREG